MNYRKSLNTVMIANSMMQMMKKTVKPITKIKAVWMLYHVRL